MTEINQVQVTAHDGTQLAAYHGGAGPGPTLVLANGLGGNIDAWRYFVDEFGPHHRIVSWDYRGLYQSSACAGGHDYTVSTQAADLRAVLDALDVADAVLVGWSMGVQVSFEFYRHHPRRVLGLVLVNGTYGRPLATAFAPVLAGSPLVPLLPAVLRAVEAVSHLAAPVQPFAQRAAQTRLALRMLRLLGLVSESLDEQMFLTLASQVAGLDMPRYLATLNSLGDHCAQAMLPHIDVPTLIVTGDRDLFTPVAQSREMASRIRAAELLVIPSGTHYVPLEFPELLHLRVAKFLRERLGFDREGPVAQAAKRNAEPVPPEAKARRPRRKTAAPA